MKKCKNKLCNNEPKNNRQYCSRKCANSDPEKKEQRNKKIEQTNLERYGARRPIQNENISEKRKNTCKERHGFVSPLQTEQGRKKWEETNKERYGVSNPSVLESTQKKIEQTNTERYGVRRPIQNDIIKEKIQQTLLNRYGVTHPSLSPDIIKKRQQTNLERYGTVHHIQKHNLPAFELLENYDWLYNEYVNLKKSAKQISNELNVNIQTVCNYIHAFDIPVRQFQKFSFKAIQWIESVEQQENITIHHAQHVGEFKIPGTKYFVDGYCEETNTVYEFHGDVWHGNPDIFDPDDCCHPYLPETPAKQLYQQTKERIQEIKQLGFNVVEMWESEWEDI